MKQLFYTIIFLPVLVFGQMKNMPLVDSEGQGIHFEQGLNWQQVLAKAKTENKYIFIDCYTTWCAPCKEMEKSEYPLENVGRFFNDKFISVKVQMDTSNKDDDAIKSWYADAHYVQERYKPEGYPTFLFFTPDGRIINRDIGLKQPDDFIKMGTDVLNPEENYYVLLEKYQHRERDVTRMGFLARRALLLGDTATSRQIAKEYILHLKNGNLLTKENIDFMYEFTKSSKDKGFNFFYRQGDSIDKIMEDDTYSQQLVQSIIHKEIVVPEIGKASKSGSIPDWAAIASVIRKKYNEYYTERVVTAARSSWALSHKNWPEYTKYLVQYQDKFGSKSSKGLMASLSLNNYAWEIFLSSKNKEELNKALSWSSRAVMMYPHPNWMDTYANLLYKLGRKQEAIMWEETSAKLQPNNKDVQLTVEKMKKDEPTWPTKN